MSTTIIFSNMGDVDTAVLRNLWNGMPDVKVVEIGKFTMNADRLVNKAIEEETDTLVMCGHGTPDGLINPNMVDFQRYLVGRHNKHLIRARRVVGIWCHAKEFAETYGVRGFWSSMFISNMMEARINGIFNTTAEQITYDETMFCLFTNYLIRMNVPQDKWINTLKACADMNDPIIRFNYNGLAYYDVAPTPKPRYNYGWYDKVMGFERNRWGWDF